MIIDDTDVDRYIAERVIRKSNFSENIISFEGVQESLDYLSTKSGTPEELPDLIFLDIRMPGYDGFDFLEMFEKLPETVKRKMIIVMLSSSLNQEDHDKALNNKYVKQFINKPLNQEGLNLITGKDNFMQSETPAP
jgi:CheY-like chemotaxis protein